MALTTEQHPKATQEELDHIATLPAGTREHVLSEEIAKRPVAVPLHKRAYPFGKPDPRK